MKAYWLKFAALIDQRTTRERMLIFVSAGAVVFTLMQSLLSGPVLSERKRLVQETTNDQAEIAKLTLQMQALVREKGADPDAALKSRLTELSSKQTELQRQVDAQSAELVSPDKMSAVLQKILANNPRVRLVEVKTLPQASVSLDKEAAPGEQKAPGPEQKVPPPEAKKPPEIFRHGMEISVRGGFLDLLAYLKDIEALPARVFWDRVSLTVTTYPSVTMRLVVYTISLDKTWLTV